MKKIFSIIGCDIESLKKIWSVKKVDNLDLDKFLKDENIEVREYFSKDELLMEVYDFLIELFQITCPEYDAEDDEDFKIQCLELGIKFNKSGIVNLRSATKFIEKNLSIRFITL